MIDTIDGEVGRWLASTAGTAAAISFALPPADAQTLTVYAYLYDVDRPNAVSSGRLPPMQLRLAYLVTVLGPDVAAAHALLGTLITAAETNGPFTVQFGPVVAAAWTALQLPARAGFVLQASASQPRDGTIAPPVRAARVDTVTVEPLFGRVTANDGTPLPGATVLAASIGRSATTDSDGRFVLEGATNAFDLALLVRAKGTETAVTHRAGATGDFTIALDAIK